jgi:hypothetical protein
LAFTRDLAGRIDGMTVRRDIEHAVGDLEYLKEVLGPELQDPAYALAERQRAELERPVG